MQHVAQGLASLGRGNDKMLVHMTPGEVQGLQRLAMAHGGSLTINPHTGLPEAGILDSLLPTLIGVGLTAATGLPAWGIGLGVGGATALASGSLQKGLMAGLGAFGGAGLGGALEGFGGAQAAKDLAVQKTMEDAAINAAAEGTQLPSWYKDVVSSTTALPAPTALAADATMADRFTSMGRGIGAAVDSPSAFGSEVTKQLGGKYGAMAAAAPTVMAGLQALNKPATLQGNAVAQNKGNIRPYQYTVGQVDPEAQRQVSQFGFSKVPYFTGQGYTAQPIYAAAAGGQVPSPSLPLDLSQNYPGSNISKSSYATLPSTDSQEVVDGYGPKINPFTGAEGMAAGGLAKFGSGGISVDSSGHRTEYSSGDDRGVISRLLSGNSYSGNGLGSGFTGLLSQIQPQGAFGSAPMDEYVYDPETQQYVKRTPDMQMAAGGIAALPEYAAGGKLLRGPGDGMSDDIPAVIKGETPQRAALADGEFVIPADVVSHLGNGSTDAGAKRLYTMMDRVRKARTGNPKQGKQINAERLMPA